MVNDKWLGDFNIMFINFIISELVIDHYESNTEENDSDDPDYIPGTDSDDTNTEIDFFMVSKKFCYVRSFSQLQVA